jgi:hypothetical protein
MSENAPLCACGCCQNVNKNVKNNKIWNRYVSGHQRTVNLQKHNLRIKNDPEYKDKCVKAILNGCAKSPNKPESIINSLTSENVQFVGNRNWWRKLRFLENGEYIEKYKNPDFKVKNQNRVIEVFGKYWHKDDDPEILINAYKEQGIDCLVIQEVDIYNNLNQVLGNISQFVNEKQWQMELNLQKPKYNPNNLCVCGCGKTVGHSHGRYRAGHKTGYYTKPIENKSPNLCLCGCGRKTTFNGKHKIWNEYCKDHKPKPEGNPPLCLCGCGGRTKWRKAVNRWGDYITGHNNRGLTKKKIPIDNAPECACGCKGSVTWDIWNRRWNTYIKSHINKINPTGDAPFCKCGCGGTTEWKHGKWNVYIKYHHLGKFENLEKNTERRLIKRKTILEIEEIIKNVIDKENPKKPFTDEDIVRLLMQKGIKKTERTIRTYREEINIQSFTKRRNFDKQITLF